MTRRLVAAAAAALAVLSVAGGRAARSQGQDPAPPAAEAPAAAEPAVDVTVVGKPADVDRVRGLTGARTPAGVPLRWGRVDRFDPLRELLRPGSPEPAVALRCWVDMTEPRRVVLYFAARGGQRFLVRGVELSGRFDELDRQSLGQVLELSISALLDSTEAGISRSEARVLLSRATPEVAAAVAPASPTPRPLALSAALFYGAQSLGGALPFVHGPGLGLALRHPVGGDGTSAIGGWATVQVQLPASTLTPEVGVRLETLPARAGAEITRGRWRGRAGAGVDWVWVSPLGVTGGPPVALASAHWSTSLVVCAAVAWRQPVGRGFDLGIALSADLLPTNVRYEVGPVGAAGVSTITPWRVRPGTSIEVAF